MFFVWRKREAGMGTPIPSGDLFGISGSQFPAWLTLPRASDLLQDSLSSSSSGTVRASFGKAGIGRREVRVGQVLSQTGGRPAVRLAPLVKRQPFRTVG